MAGTYVKFTVDQARRIAAVVRWWEKTTPDQTERRASTIDPRVLPNPTFQVKVTIDGGTSGTGTTACTWTYRVESLAGTVLGNGLTPKRRRYTPARYSETPDGTIGQAYFDQEGKLQLFDANELLVTAIC